MSALLDAELRLALEFTVALAIGLLLGVERGWEDRSTQAGGRVAGIRTFGIASLLGAAVAALAGSEGDWLLGLALIGLGWLAAAAHRRKAKQTEDIGMTTLLALMLAFVLGAMVVRGHIAIAAASAVVAALLLGAKPELHRFLERISREELLASLRLLLISVVVLPVLPNRGFGPWQALNPFKIWLLVVMIAAIAYVGYVAVRVLGARRGLLATGIFGGLASSTAVAINLGRLGRDKPALHMVLSAGILAAAAIMFPRLLIVTALVAPDLAGVIAAPVLTAGLLILAAAALYARKARAATSAPDTADTQAGPRNPLDLRAAAQFGVLLTIIMVLSKALNAWFGDRGVFALAAISGLADVDAIILSLATMFGDGDIGAGVAAGAALTAAAVNTLVKPALVWMGGGGRLALMVALPLVGALAAAAGLVWAGRVMF
ncbi:MAG: MgtC/SapB family protein [Sphingomonadales bacterium]